MTKKILFVGVLVCLLVAAAGPNVVSAEVDSLASPTPRPTERITAPVISGVNPDAVLSEGNLGESHPSGSFLPGLILLPVPMDPPAFVELESQSGSKESPAETLTGDFENVNCGPAALALAMEILDPMGKDGSPTINQLSDFMSSRGLMYDWGTGVEELAYAARELGYEGSIPFQGWSFEQLVEILKQGKPVVIPLGTNGENRPGHFVALSNISEDGMWITYYDPKKGEISLSREEFLSFWKMQGSAGMILQKESSSLAVNPMLPWMGLYGAISALALTLNQSAGWKESRVFAGLRKKLDNPRRKGIGAGP
ncbi:MAG: C39 family peptidase, partial [Anaerolineales bacterium]|nr:C39 family peptidase [Anaerolineales bacterium]